MTDLEIAEFYSTLLGPKDLSGYTPEEITEALRIAEQKIEKNATYGAMGTMKNWAYSEEAPARKSSLSIRTPLSTTLRWRYPNTENTEGFKRGELRMFASGFDGEANLPVPLNSGVKVIGTPAKIHSGVLPEHNSALYAKLEDTPVLPMALLLEALDINADEVVLDRQAVEQLLTVCGYPQEEWKALISATGPSAQDDLINYLKSKLKNS